MLVAVLLISFGVLGSVLFLSGVEAGDFRAYYHAAELAVQGESFVGAAPPGVNSYASWVYPPIAVVPFVPFTILRGWFPAFLVWNLLNVAVAIAIGQSLFKYLQEKNASLGVIDRVLIMFTFVFGSSAILNLAQGQSNFIVLGCIFYGFLSLERERPIWAGVLYAIAATIKIWPALFGVWLLYKRSYRAILAAGVVGGGLQLAGVALFGMESYSTLVRILIQDRSSTGTVSLGYVLSGLVGINAGIATVLSFGLIGSVLFLIYKNTRDTPFFSYTATIVAVVLVSPSTIQYMLFPSLGAVSLLYLTEDAASQLRFGLGLFFISIPITRYKIDTIFELLGGSFLSLPEWIGLVMNIPLWGLLLLMAALYLWSLEGKERTSASSESHPSQ